MGIYKPLIMGNHHPVVLITNIPGHIIDRSKRHLSAEGQTQHLALEKGDVSFHKWCTLVRYNNFKPLENGLIHGASGVISYN